MGTEEQKPTRHGLEVEGSAAPHQITLRWKPFPHAKSYAIEWKARDGVWFAVSTRSGRDTAPDDGDYLTYTDTYPGPMGLGGTYRVIAYLDPNFQSETASSLPIVLTPNKPNLAVLEEFSARVRSKPWSPEIKAIVSGLEWSPYGWHVLLPDDTSRLLSMCIEVEVLKPTVTDDLLDLLASILANLSALSLQAEKVFHQYLGSTTLSKEDVLKRPRIVIYDAAREEKAEGTWEFLVQVDGSDYAWHIMFERQELKGIFAGD